MVILCVYVKIKELVWSFFFTIRAAAAFAWIRFLFQAPVCTCRCEEAPLDVTRPVFMRVSANYFTRLVSSLSPCPTEPTEQRHYCTKGKRFYSQFVPFILYRGKVRKSWVVSRAYGKRDDLLDVGGSGGKENRRFECFLSALSLHSFGLFFFFSLFKEKCCRHFKEATFFLSNPQMFSLLSPVAPWEDIFKIWNEALTICMSPLPPLWRLLLRYWGKQRDTLHSHTSEAEVTAGRDNRGEKMEDVCKERKGFWEKLVDGNDVTG